MSEEKDIFDIFRESQHKLEEMPAGQVWHRIEAKLEQRKKHKPRRILFLPMSIAAAVLVVIVFSSLLALMVMRFSKDTNETISTKNPPTTADTTSTVASTNDMDSAASGVAPFSPQTGENNDLIAVAEDNLRAPMTASPTKDFSPVEESIELDKLSEVKADNKPSETNPAPDNIVAAVSRDDTETLTTLDKKKTEVAIKPSRAKAKATDSKESKPSPAATAPGSAAYALQVPEALLDKLTGTWQGVNGDVNNFEEWKQTDIHTWSGKGYMIINGDTTLIENMSIGVIGDSTYYIGRLDPFGDFFQLRLTGYDDHKAIFGEEDIPVAVTIEMAKDGTMTTTINAKPEVLNQNEYLSQRNQVKKIKRRGG